MRKLSDEPDFVFDVREDFRFYERKTKLLVGWPGYRNLPGKSGLGYIETYAEEARMESLFTIWLFTGKFRTHNPIYLVVLFILGIIMGGIPFWLIVDNLLQTGTLQMAMTLLCATPYIAAGLAILINILLSVFDPSGESITGD